ncbi:DUF7119 family protein [Haloplanus aerogenes]|uniref:DUF7119 domain-containing protein n=1 Tax=Haloplanus aerogenes TaxID=660522 RepID=A0A3M0DRJ5_9EURY|nr:hypothetical protein [Haloplanus aerogenes]AZH24331.1 hypothetical protein DU502_02590 [Haloplanus aerogenes]RMB24035.1 hypothetical protein ATH50_1269 [Haloplanus aerogenes]
MSDDPDASDRPVDRESPVGEPVVRADPAVTGERATEAVGFDPDDPESVQLAADTVRSFAENTVGSEDHVYMLRGAAACAALVRGVGSYKAAAERAGGDVSVAFIRKWARVHDLPQAIRRHVARGTIAPTAAKHIARVSGDDRYALAWATLEHDLTVREIRRLASEVGNGASVEAALDDRDLTLGHMDVTLPPDQYIELRRRASVENRDPDDLLAAALDEFLEL